MTVDANADTIGAVTLARGFRAGGFAAGMKESGNPDLALLISDEPATAAAVFTTSAFQAAPLHLSRQHVANNQIRAVVVNAGNANCATGEAGFADAQEMAALTADKLGLAASDVFVNSTGIIGHRLAMNLVRQGISGCELHADGGGRFAIAITTTDTHAKEATATFEANGQRYTIGGCCKGSGMIHPNMATMLAFVTTDAPIAAEVLTAQLRWTVDRSINMVTVDGDTSTNDSTLVLANGAAGGPTIEPADTDGVAAFQTALLAVLTDLARMIARDGEGASKVIEMTVSGAACFEDARDVSRTIVTSPLVKAALNKGDPENWGRVLMASGYAGVAYDQHDVRLWLGDTQVVEGGASLGIADEVVKVAAGGDPVRMRLDLGMGAESVTAWGCDLTEEYVRFNADYVT
ncbi:MAG TPA: bifunctional glutamate N-acetyltransferase/amino-acid acetyltransferase ArgJ [Dehalococcoidia bacterium]|nr:bifunctional glutamate N-acetyltransferase/amino-acid acetyltransferase ArgJ [Dehalococcoidia bacterium]